MKISKISLLQAKPTLLLLALLQAYFIWLFIGQGLSAQRTIDVPIYLGSTQEIIAVPDVARITVRGPRRLLKHVEFAKPFVHVPLNQDNKHNSAKIELTPDMVIISEPFECLAIVPASVEVQHPVQPTT